MRVLILGGRLYRASHRAPADRLWPPGHDFPAGIRLGELATLAVRDLAGKGVVVSNTESGGNTKYCDE